MIAAVDPGVGGVLVLGERGTGKSTTIRALAAMLPTIDVVDQCLYQCDPRAPRPGLCAHCGKPAETPASRAVTIPVVDLPLGSTEDRVVGALDIERALVNGEKAFQPGLLAQANRGFLYVDEVNLLEDHIVDALLDVAASGENVVEREGLSIRHPARFVLVGSGNPEEGELRPQLQDRFGLSVDVRTPSDVPTRVEIIRQREAFDHDRAAFKKMGTQRERIASKNTKRQSLSGWRRYAGPTIGNGRSPMSLFRYGRAARRIDASPQRTCTSGVTRQECRVTITSENRGNFSTSASLETRPTG